MDTQRKLIIPLSLEVPFFLTWYSWRSLWISALTSAALVRELSALLVSSRMMESELDSSSLCLRHRLNFPSASASLMDKLWKNESLSAARCRLINDRAWAGANSFVLALELSCNNTSSSWAFLTAKRTASAKLANLASNVRLMESYLKKCIQRGAVYKY